MSTAMAFSKAFSVMTSEGFKSSRSSPRILCPLSLAIFSFKALTARAVAQPGRDIPMASVIQAMVLAVNMPLQDPQPGHAASSSLFSSSSLILPATTFPTASEIEAKLTFFPFKRPASMGPPVTTMEGKLSLADAISMPGVILSQFVIKTMPSNLWA